MSFWVLLQILVNLVLVAAVVALWFKLQRPTKDDPRLSRGLQLLQSKIAVLEDLSDRTETQVHQLTGLIEQKCKEIQTHILAADRQIQQIDVSMNRSLEVAKIFQDKIPHQEIIERQNTIKYVKAARMAHQGATIEDICQAVDLTRGEVEFIAKVNRDQLQFSEADLPEWALDSSQATAPAPMSSPAAMTSPTAMTSPQAPTPAVHPREVENETLSQLGEQFCKALGPSEPQFVEPVPPLPPIPTVPQPSLRPREAAVRKVVFPKIDVSKNLG